MSKKAKKIKCETEDNVEATNYSSILLKLNSFRKEGEYCDVTIIVDDEKFKAHRLVLSALSPYFEALLCKNFAESKKEEIEIPEVDPNIMGNIFDFAYTNSLKLTRSTASELLIAADRFQISEVKKKVCKYLECRIDFSNCVEIFCISYNMLHCNNLKQKSKNFILRTFSELYEDSCFGQLNMEMLSDITCDNNLLVQEEATVFKAVVKWLDEHPDISKENSVAILKTVRFANLSPNFLVDEIDRHPVCKSSDELQLLIKKVLAFRLDPNISIPPLMKEHRKIVFDQFGLAIVENQKWFIADEGALIWCYNPLSQKIQYKLPPLLHIKTKPALVAHDQHLYAIGSTVVRDFNNVNNRYTQNLVLEKYDLRQTGNSKKWIHLGVVPNTVTSSYAPYVVATLRNMLFIKVNGKEGLDIYDISTDRWFKSNNLKSVTMSEGYGICSMFNYIYLVGGGLRFDTVTGTWDSVPCFAEKIDYPGVAVKDGKIWVKKNKDWAFVYDHYTNFWSSRPLHSTDDWPIITSRLPM